MSEWWIVNGGAVKELYFYGFWAGIGWATAVILIKLVFGSVIYGVNKWVKNR